LRDVHVGDDPVLQRSYRHDSLGRATQHPLRLEADPLDPVRAPLDRHDRGFVQYDPLALDVDERVRGAEVDRDVVDGQQPARAQNAPKRHTPRPAGLIPAISPCPVGRNRRVPTPAGSRVRKLGPPPRSGKQKRGENRGPTRDRAAITTLASRTRDAGPGITPIPGRPVCSVTPRAAEAAAAPPRRRELVGRLPLDADDLRDQHLRDPLAMRNLLRLTIEVDERDTDLAAVVAV